MTKPPDALRFKGGIVKEMPNEYRLGGYPDITMLQDDGGHMRAWDGPWPPPERFGLAIGNLSGYPSIFTEDDLASKGVKLEELAAIAKIMWYKRISYSLLPDEMDSEHVFRGALYEPDDE